MEAYFKGTKIAEFCGFCEGDAKDWVIVKLVDCDFPIAVHEMFVVIE